MYFFKQKIVIYVQLFNTAVLKHLYTSLKRENLTKYLKFYKKFIGYP